MWSPRLIRTYFLFSVALQASVNLCAFGWGADRVWLERYLWAIGVSYGACWSTFTVLIFEPDPS